MEDALQRAEKAWSEMDQVTREVVAETLFMLVVRHASSLALRNEELEARQAQTLEALQLADAALSGANMDMGVVERKVKAAIASLKET